MIVEATGFARAIIRFTGRRGVAAGLFVVTGALLEGVGVLLLVPLLSALFGSSANGSVARLGGWIGPGLDTLQRLAAVLAVFGLVMTVRAFVLWRRDATLGALQIGFVEAQRAVLARSLVEAGWPALARLGHGRVNHLMGGDIQRCGIGVGFLFQSSVAAVMVTTQIAVALALAPLPAAIALASIAAGALALSTLVRRAHDAGATVTAAQLAVTTAIGRFLSGMKMAISQNLQGGFVTAFERDLARGARAQGAFLSQQGLMRALWSLLAAGVAGMTILLGYGVFHLPAPVLLALLVLLARISGPAAQIHNGLQQIAYSLPAWRAIRAIDRDLAAAPISVQDVLPRGAITFESVRYIHDGADGGVADLMLRVAPGEMLGVTGASGAGKTTFADLLTGLLAPHSGRIAIGGIALDARAIAAWRDRIAYVAQDPVLFNGTMRENLLWANPAASDAAIAAAIETAGATQLIAALPRGLDTVVGEGGALISGGERQRIAIARALLRDPDLLLLDEATNAIDIAGERALLERLRALTPRPTVVVIAHRVESLSACDRVVTFANGRVVREDRMGGAPSVRLSA